mmetsp:Transcript_37487/g.27248  ORF Transcript_37487/g.27248 Transcript_37487/m.27248 type:complete len:216 (+) Transcript_37487:325-972(+)
MVLKDNYSEEDWSNEDSPIVTPYYKSKTLAERAAWNFVEELPEDEKFELVTINPSLIMGPTKVADGFSSGKILQMVMNREFPSSPKVYFGLVDVRDTAEAHLKAITVSEAANKRFILCAETLKFGQIAEKLSSEFSPDYRLPEGDLGYCMIYIGSWFDRGAADMAKQWDWSKTYDNSRSREILGINYRPSKDSLIEMAHAMIDSGIIEDKRTEKK